MVEKSRQLPQRRGKPNLITESLTEGVLLTYAKMKQGERFFKGYAGGK
jgi:hypothetical protein